jgi:choline kinase
MIPRDATFIPVEWPEWIDIDTEHDLKMAQAVKHG